MRFGTDGIRGPAGVAPIDADGARRVGAAALAWTRDAGGASQVTVACDTRPSAATLVDAVCAGVVAAGGVARRAGVLPTAGLATVVARDGGAGVMVTASHNPADDNGFKVFGPGGRKPDDARTAWLEAVLGAAPQAVPGGRVDDVSAHALATWTAAWRDALGDVRALAGKRVAVDLAHGAATRMVDALHDALPDTELVLVGTGDGRINDGVGSEHPELLRTVVRLHDCDAGLAVDGDADRALLVDARGEVLPGDVVTWLLASGLGVSSLAVTVMSTGALADALPGVRVVTTPVGDRHLAEAILRDGVALGAEESGHVLFAGPVPGGDGLITGLRALALGLRTGPLADAAAGFVPWPRRLTKVRASARMAVDGPVLAPVVAAASARIAPGRVLVRWSGTEPVLRVLVEGPRRDVVEAESAALTAACAAALGVA